MRPYGDLDVLSNLLNGEEGVFISSGGAIRAIRAAAVATGIEERIPVENLSMVGFSSGALILTALCSGRAHMGQDIVLQLANGGFFQMYRYVPFLVRAFDLPLLTKVIEPIINDKKIKAHPRDVLFGTTNFHKGDGELVCVRTSDVMGALNATIAIPGLCSPEWVCNRQGENVLAVDGMPSMQFVDAIKLLRARNILVVYNSMLPVKSNLVEDLLYQFLIRWYLWSVPKALLKTALGMDKSVAANIACMLRRRRKKIKILIVSADGDDTTVWPWTSDEASLTTAYTGWYEAFSKLLDQAQPRQWV